MTSRIDVLQEVTNPVVITENGVTKATNVIELGTGGPTLDASTSGLLLVKEPSGNVVSAVATVSMATDYLLITPSASPDPVRMETFGSGSNISLVVAAKGDGTVHLESPISFDDKLFSANVPPLILSDLFKDVVVPNLNASYLQGMNVSQIASNFTFTGVLSIPNGGTNNDSFVADKFIVYDLLENKLVSSNYDLDSFLPRIPGVADGHVPVASGGVLADSGFPISVSVVANTIPVRDGNGDIAANGIIVDTISSNGPEITFDTPVVLTDVEITGVLTGIDQNTYHLVSLESQLTSIISPVSGDIVLVGDSPYQSFIRVEDAWRQIGGGGSLSGSLYKENDYLVFEDESNTKYYISNLTRKVIGEALTVVPASGDLQFTTDFAFQNMALYRNGMRQVGGGVDYTVLNTTTIELVMPADGDTLIADYETASFPV